MNIEDIRDYCLAMNDVLRETFHCVLPGYHMNKKHWNTILVDGTVKNSQLKEWIDHSYALLIKKKK